MMNLLKYLNYKYLKYFLYVVILVFIVTYFRTNNSTYLVLSITFIIASNFIDDWLEAITGPTIRDMSSEEIQVIKAMILANEKDVAVIKKIREYTNLGLVQAKNLYDEIKGDMK